MNTELTGIIFRQSLTMALYPNNAGCVECGQLAV